MRGNKTAIFRKQKNKIKVVVLGNVHVGFVAVPESGGGCCAIRFAARALRALLGTGWHPPSP